MDLVKLKVIINHKEHIIPQIHNKITFIKIPASWLAFQTRKGSKINFFKYFKANLVVVNKKWRLHTTLGIQILDLEVIRHQEEFDQISFKLFCNDVDYTGFTRQRKKGEKKDLCTWRNRFKAINIHCIDSSSGFMKFSAFDMAINTSVVTRSGTP